MPANDPPSWLDEVTVRQSKSIAWQITYPVPTFSHIDQLRKYQQQVLQDWSEYLGNFQQSEFSELKLRVLEKAQHEPGIDRWLIEYETEPDQQVQAFVLLPDVANRQKVPGVVVFHSTVENSLFQPVGLGGRENPNVSEDELRKAYALHLARRGFVALAPRNFLWPTNLGLAAKQQTAAFQQRHPNRTGMSRMLLDCVRAVDVLCSLTQVDSAKIGAVGHSLGAKEVLYLAAFDSRVVATVSSEGGISIAQSNWEADWYLGSACKKTEFQLGHHQLLAAIAPRAFLLIGGQSADGDASLSTLSEASRAFEIAGKKHHLAFYNHRQGHTVTQESLDRTIQWLLWQLK